MPACEKRERQERADGVERNQPIGNAVEHSQQDGGQDGEEVTIP